MCQCACLKKPPASGAGVRLPVLVEASRREEDSAGEGRPAQHPECCVSRSHLPRFYTTLVSQSTSVFTGCTDKSNQTTAQTKRAKQNPVHAPGAGHVGGCRGGGRRRRGEGPCPATPRGPPTTPFRGGPARKAEVPGVAVSGLLFFSKCSGQLAGGQGRGHGSLGSGAGAGEGEGLPGCSRRKSRPSALGWARSTVNHAAEVALPPGPASPAPQLRPAGGCGLVVRRILTRGAARGAFTKCRWTCLPGGRGFELKLALEHGRRSENLCEEMWGEPGCRRAWECPKSPPGPPRGGACPVQASRLAPLSHFTDEETGVQGSSETQPKGRSGCDARSRADTRSRQVLALPTSHLDLAQELAEEAGPPQCRAVTWSPPWEGQSHRGPCPTRARARLLASAGSMVLGFLSFFRGLFAEGTSHSPGPGAGRPLGDSLWGQECGGDPPHGCRLL